MKIEAIIPLRKRKMIWVDLDRNENASFAQGKADCVNKMDLKYQELVGFTGISDFSMEVFDEEKLQKNLLKKVKDHKQKSNYEVNTINRR